MKDLEKILENLAVPSSVDEEFETSLRRNLRDRYFRKIYNYRFRFRAALAFCFLLLVFGFTAILKPDLVVKINNLAFNKNIKIVTADQDYEALKNLAYSSIYNPHLSSKVDPNKYQEDKTYLVRKYVSSEEGGLMIVSEFNRNQKKQSAKRISY
jgi:hypothetical protein